MKLPQYEIEAEDSLEVFEFVSEGNIRKYPKTYKV